MNLDNIFVNKIEELNCYSQDLKYHNFRQWAENENLNGRMNTFEYKKIQMYHDMRNMISHGGSGRIEFFQEDIDFLDKYIKLFQKILGIETVVKEEKPVVIKEVVTTVYTPKDKGTSSIEKYYNDPTDYSHLKDEFKTYFLNKRPDYKNPVPLFGMAFYCSRHNLGFTLNDVLTGKILLNEYAEILKAHFIELGSNNPNSRTGAYKDAMKNLLEFARYKGILK